MPNAATAAGRPTTNAPRSAQEAASAALWDGDDLIDAYATRELRPVEVMVLVRHREALAGRVLELGCGAGRITGYLADMARTLEATDISAAMVAACARRCPRASVRQEDLRAISEREPGSVDAVVASFNVLDVLDDVARHRILDGIHRALNPDGHLLMSTHNRAYAPRIGPPAVTAPSDPLRFASDVKRLPSRLRNRRRLLRLQRFERDYAILNDAGHDYAALHYYITRDAQERQLEQHGFELVECLDLDGRPVEAGEHAHTCPELHYVARRRA